MIFTVPLQPGTVLGNVAYRWIASGVIGSQLTAGITQPSASFPVFRISATPPSGAEELIVYDSTDLTNWNVGSYMVASLFADPAPSTSAIDAALTSSHGAGSWQTGSSGGTGAYDVAVTVTDADSVPLQNAMVRLTEGMNSYLVQTDVDGLAEFSLDAATYRLAITKPGYSFTPANVIVTGDADLTEQMTAIAVPGPPSDLSLCRVYGYFETLDNQSSDKMKIFFALTRLDPVKSDRIITERIIEASILEGTLTDADGNPWQDLQRNDLLTPSGTGYLVTCKAAGFQKTPMTLAADLFDLATLIS